MSASRRLLLLLLLCALPLQGAVAASRLCLATLASPERAARSDAFDAPAGAHDHRAHHAGAHGPADAQAPASHADDGDAGDAQASDTCSLCAACCLTVAVAPQAPGVVVLPPAHAGFAPVSVPDVSDVASGLERPPRTI